METRTKYMCLALAAICAVGLLVIFIMVDRKVGSGMTDKYTRQYTVQPKVPLLLYTFRCVQDRVGVSVQSTDIVDYYMEDKAGTVVYRQDNTTVFTLNVHVPRGTKLFVMNSLQNDMVIMDISVHVTCELTLLLILLGTVLVISGLIVAFAITSIAYPAYIRRNFPREYERECEMTELI